MTGYLTPLTVMQIHCLHARLTVAGEDLRELLYGENPVGGEGKRASLLAMQDELSDLHWDAINEMNPAHEREIGADMMAAAIQHNHLAAITKAEQLLAAERIAGAA